MPILKHLTIAVLFVFLTIGFADSVMGDSGLPLPRFVSLRSGKVYMRTGPGMQYPVDWVYRRQGLPVEVIAEYYDWRRVRDPTGVSGWVHSSMLSGRRTIVVSSQGEALLLRAKPDNSAPAVAKVEPGAIAEIKKCAAQSWCRVDFGRHRGWLRRDQIWGLYPEETLD